MSLKKEPGDCIARMGEHAFKGGILERIARACEPISLRAQHRPGRALLEDVLGA
jgi:hypothetical protein